MSLEAAESLVARGDGVPGRFATSPLSVVLPHRLEVTSQDQIPDGDTQVSRVPNALQPSRDPDLPELLVGRHLLADGAQLRLVLSLVSPLGLDRPLELSLQRREVDDITLRCRHRLLMSHTHTPDQCLAEKLLIQSPQCQYYKFCSGPAAILQSNTAERVKQPENPTDSNVSWAVSTLADKIKMLDEQLAR